MQFQSIENKSEDVPKLARELIERLTELLFVYFVRRFVKRDDNNSINNNNGSNSNNNNLAVPGDQNITAKEQEKITKYQDLRIEIEKLWDVKAVVVQIVVGALGTVSKNIYNE